MTENSATTVATDTFGPFTQVSVGLSGDHEGKAVVNAYIVRDGNTAAFLDSGVVWGYDRLTEAIDRLGLQPSDVKYLLNTHEHMDHVGNNARLVKETGCRVGAHPGRADWIADNALNARMMVQRFPDAAPLFDLTEEYLSWMGDEAAPVDFFLTEGAKVDVGNITLEIVELHGHSLGEIGFWEAESGVFMFGDVLLPQDNPVLYLYEDPTIMRTTCEKLAHFLSERDVKLVYSGHGAPCGKQEAIEWANECRERVDQIHESVVGSIKKASSGATLADVRDEVCDAFGKVREWRALITIDGHLTELERTSSIEKRDGRWYWAAA